MLRIVHLMALSLTSIALAGQWAHGEPAPSAKPTAEQQAKFRALENQSLNLESQGNLKQARVTAEALLKLEQEALGEASGPSTQTLHRLTDLSMRLEDFAAARQYGRKALDLRTQHIGESDWRTLDSKRKLADVDFRAALPQEKRAELAKSERHIRDGERLFARGDYAKAEAEYKAAMHIREAILGKKHPEYVTGYNGLAWCYLYEGQYDKAEPLLREIVELEKEICSRNHPHYATALNNLAACFQWQGLYPKAESLYLEALEITRSVAGKDHPDFADGLNNLATLYQLQGRYAKAETLFIDALKIWREENHSNLAQGLHNLGALYREQGLYAKAEPQYEKALRLRKKVGGAELAQSVNDMAILYACQGLNAKAEEYFENARTGYLFTLGANHPEYAATLNNLGNLYRAQNLFEKAEPLLKKALQIYKDALGEKHPYTAQSLNNLGLFYASQGLVDKAEPLFQQSLRIRKQALGDKHPRCAESLNNLASVCLSKGSFADAERLSNEALQIARSTLGEKHPHCAVYLNALARVYDRQGQTTKAAQRFKEAIQIMEDHLEQTAVIQSESAQLTNAAVARLFLNNLLSLPGTDPAQVYASAFRWRSAVTARQAVARAARATNPALRETVGELRDVAERLSHLVSRFPGPDAKIDLTKMINELNERREGLEKKLAAQSSEFARLRENRGVTPADLQKRLPPGAAFVDFLAFGDKMAAFIVTPEAIARVDLIGGKGLAELVEHFRSNANLNLGRPAKEAQSDKEDIRKVVWGPLAPHLRSAKLVLICPDGPLCRLPFAALRGSGPKKYLIEEVALAVVPVPRLLPELLAQRPAAVAGSPSLLLLGDVDFGANPRAERVVAARRGGQDGWHALPGTRVEMDAIEALFKAQAKDSAIKLLSKEQATETAVRQSAGQYRYLHLATHGQFLAPQAVPKFDGGSDAWMASQVRAAGVNAEVLSRLVFAGANRPTAGSNGVLSALEIAEMDLSGVELAVLSACETGLGDVAEGEGVLGLQRAFLFAGARTTVTSLWQIPDGATAPLMVRFYENRLKKGMSVLESLREAQLWILNNGIASGALSEAPVKGLRTPPLYWSGFVLAGDWR